MREITTYTTTHRCPHGNEVIETTSYDDKRDKCLGSEWYILCDECDSKYKMRFNGKYWEMIERCDDGTG